jgi:hypothetical protein
MENNSTNRGYKVTNPDYTCRDFKFEVGKTYTHEGSIGLCSSGFHFCRQPNHCFNYYSFDPNNKVFEVEFGTNVFHGDDKSVTSELTIIREIEWAEVLTLVNTGVNNTGHSNSGNWNSGNWNSGNWNSGDRNSGNWNSGDRNSGDRNSGDSNSGYRNSGDRNSGDSNSGYRNSGNWNSGDRNSGDSNSGYRNSGAFCTDSDPKLVLFDKLTNITVREWEQMRVVRLMSNIDPTIWVPSSIMTAEEKKQNPKWETAEGYLKSIPIHDAWKNAWGNFSEDDKQEFLTLPGFDKDKFKEITGIEVKVGKKK